MPNLLIFDEALDYPEPSDEDLYEHWSGRGHIEFFVVQNAGDIFEIEYVDYSGCAGGLMETLGIDEWSLQNVLGIDRAELREGVYYTIHGLTVVWTRGDGWTTDDDVEYYWEELTHDATLWGYLSHKIDMIWWRQVRCRWHTIKKFFQV